MKQIIAVVAGATALALGSASFAPTAGANATPSRAGIVKAAPAATHRRSAPSVAVATSLASALKTTGASLTGLRAASTFSDYVVCVTAVGGYIASLIIARKFWAIPGWAWSRIWQSCWRFIRS